MHIFLDHPDVFNLITQVLKNGDLFLIEGRKRPVTRKKESEQCDIASFEDKGRGPCDKDVGCL